MNRWRGCRAEGSGQRFSQLVFFQRPLSPVVSILDRRLSSPPTAYRLPPTGRFAACAFWYLGRSDYARYCAEASRGGA